MTFRESCSIRTRSAPMARWRSPRSSRRRTARCSPTRSPTMAAIARTSGFETSTTGRDLPDCLHWVKFASLAWTHRDAMGSSTCASPSREPCRRKTSSTLAESIFIVLGTRRPGTSWCSNGRTPEDVVPLVDVTRRRPLARRHGAARRQRRQRDLLDRSVGTGRLRPDDPGLHRLRRRPTRSSTRRTDVCSSEPPGMRRTAGSLPWTPTQPTAPFEEVVARSSDRLSAAVLARPHDRGGVSARTRATGWRCSTRRAAPLAKSACRASDR